jgi:hypothetical protein
VQKVSRGIWDIFIGERKEICGAEECSDGGKKQDQVVILKFQRKKALIAFRF